MTVCEIKFKTDAKSGTPARIDTLLGYSDIYVINFNSFLVEDQVVLKMETNLKAVDKLTITFLVDNCIEWCLPTRIVTHGH